MRPAADQAQDERSAEADAHDADPELDRPAPVVKAAKAACAAAFPLTRATAIMKMQSASAAITGHSAA